MRVVTEEAELTAGWFSAVLGARVTGVVIEPMDIGAMCRMVRARLTGDGVPGSVIVKFPTADESTLGLARAMGMYELEVRFYAELRPVLGDVSVPDCFLAEHAADTGMFTLVLEDLSDRARAGDVLTEASPDDCATVLAELAVLQAASWNAEPTRRMAWLADPERTRQVFDMMPAGLEGFVARFGSKLDPEHVELFERVIPQAGRWIRSWDGPTVVQHGDLRTDNILFGVDGGATIIDWQTVRLGPPGIDPSYLLGSSVSTATRRATERDLLRDHHARLVAAGVAGFDFDDCWRAYREGAMYAVYLFCGLSGQVAPSERIDRVIADQTRRYADMALDLEAPQLAGLV